VWIVIGHVTKPPAVRTKGGEGWVPITVGRLFIGYIRLLEGKPWGKLKRTQAWRPNTSGPSAVHL